MVTILASSGSRITTARSRKRNKGNAEEKDVKKDVLTRTVAVTQSWI
ncbi:hypothetical protein [Pyrobaculum neutrophilum]|nr:hypothetical protein [Pyrobaculum neutrophilum]